MISQQSESIVTVDCPYCGARMGQPCVNRGTGRAATNPHLIRVNTYRMTMTREEWEKKHGKPRIGRNRFTQN